MAPQGYLWWYLDGLSDDGRQAITLIAFVGSVFSPYYAWSGRRDPLNHCALNVALSGSRSRWTMTERGRNAIERSPTALRIGPSSLCWRDGTLEVRIDEVGAPIPRRVKGTVRVTPRLLPATAYQLDAAGRHVWQPIAPRAHIAVELEQPRIAWQGEAYLDSNFGTEPLEAGFKEWTWSRAHLADDTVVFYEAERRDGSQKALALRFAPDGSVSTPEPPPAAPLPRTFWRLARSTRADAGATATIRRTLEDGPFYARTLLDTTLYGERVGTIHETLSGPRFAAPSVRLMLPFRMPRRWF